MSDLESFRAETRAWLEANCPPEMREPVRDESDVCWGGRNPVFKNDAQKRWLDAMAERGWTVPDWPKEYGGGGLSPAETKILQPGNGADRRPQPADELRHLDARPGLAQIWQRGAEEALPARDRPRRDPLVPGLFRARRRLRPRLACRPNARTRATIGWSTARRSGPAMPTRPTGSSAWSAPIPQAPKHKGISFLLFDMASPGVSTRPILLISGYSPFCETFFDDVKVPKDQMVGELNKGWDVAKYLLGHEREMISGMGLGGQRDSLGEALARRARGRSDAARRRRPLRRRRDGVPGDVRAVHRRTEGRPGPSRPSPR